MEVELEVLKVLIDNQEKIIKKDGWGSHKIYRNINNRSKEEVKLALVSLCDKKLIKSMLVKNGDIKDYIYRINEDGIKFYNKESEKMSIINNIETMVVEDIGKIDEIVLMDYDKQKDYYIELTSKYHNMINGFGNSLYGYYKDKDFFDEDVGKNSLIVNFKRIKAMLIAFKTNGFKNFDDKKSIQPIINNTMTNTNNNNNNNTNTNTNDINVTFNSVRENIEKMDNLTDNELNEIISKIDGIEEIIKSNETKRSKWNKLKPFLIWVADKGADVAISLLPLFLQFK